MLQSDIYIERGRGNVPRVPDHDMSLDQALGVFSWTPQVAHSYHMGPNSTANPMHAMSRVLCMNTAFPKTLSLV